jgi:hypothetical protein
MGDNVEIDLEYTGYEGMVLIQAVQVGVRWQTWQNGN